jgi:hypothetical protein
MGYFNNEIAIEIENKIKTDARNGEFAEGMCEGCGKVPMDNAEEGLCAECYVEKLEMQRDKWAEEPSQDITGASDDTEYPDR